MYMRLTTLLYAFVCLLSNIGDVKPINIPKAFKKAFMLSLCFQGISKMSLIIGPFVIQMFYCKQ